MHSNARCATFDTGLWDVALWGFVRTAMARCVTSAVMVFCRRLAHHFADQPLEMGRDRGRACDAAQHAVRPHFLRHSQLRAAEKHDEEHDCYGCRGV